MARRSALPPESFNEILAWLNPDREVAGNMYVQLCQDLIKVFTWNRCADPEGLTDETVDRVARNVHDLRQTYEGDPRRYFHGVARNLIKETRKKLKTQASLDEIDPATRITEIANETAIMREECLHLCLQKLSSEKRELILSYYTRQKQTKIDHRSEMAQRLGTNVENLRLKVYRIRARLQECVERCLERKERGE